MASGIKQALIPQGIHSLPGVITCTSLRRCCSGKKTETFNQIYLEEI